jgi:hypothetical protein
MRPGFPSLSLASASAFAVRAAPPAAPAQWSVSSPTTVAEGNSGTTAVEFTITRTAGGGAMTIDYALSGVSANPINDADVQGNISDYSGSLLFPVPGSQVVTVLVTGDTDIEATERMRMTISNPSSGTISVATSDSEVSNDDAVAFEAAYSFTKLTPTVPLFTYPSNMVAPDKIYAPNVVDVRTHPLYADVNAPDFLMYMTTDHSLGRGGCWLWCCKGDPRVPANWKDYADALTAGWFDSFATKPAANPIFIHDPTGSPTLQNETFYGHRIGDQFVATYQVDAGVIPGSRTQTTVRSQISADGINWAPGSTNLIQVLESQGPVDGHVGYFQMQKNDLLSGIPFAWWAKSLAGGTTRSVEAVWGFDDPFTGTPQLQYLIGSQYGPALDDIPRTGSASETRVSMARYRPRTTPQGLSAIVIPSAAGAGAENTFPRIWEALISSDGRYLVSEPILVLDTGAPGAWDETAVSPGGFIEYGGDLVMMYTGTDASDVRSCGIAVAPLTGTAPSFTPVAIVPPSGLSVDVVDFTAIASLPAGYTEVQAGSVLPAKSFGVGGLTITVDGTATPTKPSWLLFRDGGFVPDDVEFFDIYLEGLRTVSASAYRDFYIGFSDAKDATALNNARTVFLGTRTNHNGDPGFFVNTQGGAGGRIQTFDISRPRPGYGPDPGVSYIWAKSPKLIGLRYYTKQDRLIGLSEGLGEMNEFNFPITQRLEKNRTYYPFIALLGTEVAAAQERFRKLTTRWKPGAAGSGKSSPWVFKKRTPLVFINHMREVYKIGASVFTSRAAFEADSRVTLIGGTNGQYAIDLSAHTADLVAGVAVVCDADLGAFATTQSRRLWTIDDGADAVEGDEAIFGYWGTDGRLFGQAISGGVTTLNFTQTSHAVETASTRRTHAALFRPNLYYHSSLANTNFDSSGAMPTGLSRLLVGGNAINATRTFGGTVQTLALFAGAAALKFNRFEIEAMKNELL